MTERSAGLRIWVALDQSPRSAAALDAAAELAAELDAELAGLFVEDINLQRLIGLPFAREFSMLWGARELTLGEMERAWRRDAEALQRLLSDAAARQRLRWSFRVARGRLAAEVDTLAQALDLVVLGQRSGAGVRSSATTRPRQAPPQARPVLVVFEGAASSARCLDAAVRLARRSGAGLGVLVRAPDDAAYRAACQTAQDELRARGASGRCLRLEVLDGPGLAEAAQREHAACLVLADRVRLAGGASFERMLDDIDCPIVLTR